MSLLRTAQLSLMFLCPVLKSDYCLDECHPTSEVKELPPELAAQGSQKGELSCFHNPQGNPAAERATHEVNVQCCSKQPSQTAVLVCRHSFPECSLREEDVLEGRSARTWLCTWGPAWGGGGGSCWQMPVGVQARVGTLRSWLSLHKFLDYVCFVLM